MILTIARATSASACRPACNSEFRLLSHVRSPGGQRRFSVLGLAARKRYGLRPIEGAAWRCVRAGELRRLAYVRDPRGQQSGQCWGAPPVSGAVVADHGQASHQREWLSRLPALAPRIPAAFVRTTGRYRVGEKTRERVQLARWTATGREAERIGSACQRYYEHDRMASEHTLSAPSVLALPEPARLTNHH